MDPLGVYEGAIHCWDWSDLRESGGVPGGRLVVWPDRLEMTGRGLLKAVLRSRTVPKERVRLIRPVLALNPLQQMISAVHPLARDRHLINFVISAPKEQPVGTGDIYYLLALISQDAADLLSLLDGAGYPVSRVPVRTTQLDIGGELSWRDFKSRRGIR